MNRPKNTVKITDCQEIEGNRYRITGICNKRGFVWIEGVKRGTYQIKHTFRPDGIFSAEEKRVITGACHIEISKKYQN